MPYIKISPKSLPRAKLLDIKAQKCGLRHTVFSANGNEYTGEWKDNMKHGKGCQLWKRSCAEYNGEWKFGKCDGYGTYSVLLPETKEYAKKYCGEWKNGKKHGYGTYVYDTSAVYEGEWVEDQRHGLGAMYDKSGDIYKGDWINNERHGLGIIRFANGNWYEGSWRDDKKNGDGKLYYADKGQLYEGFWVDGVAKCGTLSDFGKEEAPTPTKYPIPQIRLSDMQAVLREAKSAYLDILLDEEAEDSQHVSTEPLSGSEYK